MAWLCDGKVISFPLQAVSENGLPCTRVNNCFLVTFEFKSIKSHLKTVKRLSLKL